MRSRLPPLALTYHSVATGRWDRDENVVWADDLRRHIDHLRRWGYRLVSFADLAALAQRGAAEGNAALTFDDGYSDNLENLVPLLEELDATATVFVIAGWLGRSIPWSPSSRVLTGDEVRELHRSGVEVGAHTMTHPDLTTLAFEQVVDELAGSRRELEALLGEPVETLAYPYGRVSVETLEACKAVEFKAACRSRGLGSWQEPLNLPRQEMNNGSSMLGLRLKRHGLYEPMMRWLPARVLRRSVRFLRRRVR